MTLLVSAISLVFGTLVGFLGAGAKLSRRRAARVVADVYTTVIRGIPELIIILLLYFGGTVTLTALAGHYVEVNGFGAGVFALSVVFGAYATEIFRGAVLAIPRGQGEAARALGMKRGAVFWTILLPQLWRFALPGIGNLWLVLLKDSALISVVGLEELLRKTAITAGATRQPFTFYFAAAMIYLLFTVVSSTVLHWAERRAARGLQSA